MLRSVITGCGAYLPKRVLTNDDLAEMVDTTDDWIVERTGIRQRHIAAEGEKTSDLSVAAARRALEDAGVGAEELDLIVLATSTPDETFPATATAVQASLGVKQGAAFDIQAVCTGFIYALAVADNFIKAGQSKCALVIGAETFSRILDWEDRATCVLFGDGAGATVLQAVEGEGVIADRGILSTHLHADGSKHDLLYVDGGPSSTQTTGHVRMQGRQLYRQAVVNLAAVVKETLDASGLSAEEIDWLVPHQANKRIIDSTVRKLGLDAEKVIVTIERHANTSAASVPLALAEAVADGRIKRGDMVLMEAMGGGFTWGACLVRW
ncbi:MAG: ketoacyl-ACP synthase III [Alphaproteobacteria bacterium]|nr:ketoacyl-ACP synthase III [Alphaproteobacteria bacterium]